MMDNIRNSVLVTGAARRVGGDIALGLADVGWAVALHYNRSDREAENLAETIVSRGGRAATVRADLADEDQARGLVDKATAALGPIQCLINNASVFEHDSVETATKRSWDEHMQVNLRSPFVLIQQFAARLAPDGQGNVINIIDQRVWNLTPHFVSYTLSKAGLWTLTQSLAQALAPRVRVNAIGPGPVLASERQSEGAFIEQWSSLPLGRRVQTSEIVGAIRFILDTPSMTGQMIALDSGQHLGWMPGSASDGPQE